MRRKENGISYDRIGSRWDIDKFTKGYYRKNKEGII